MLSRERGTTFRVLLPMLRNALPRSRDGRAHIMSAKTVLIADDDSAIRTVLSQALNRAGYSVRSTGTAASLWHWVSEGQGDVGRHRCGAARRKCVRRDSAHQEDPAAICRSSS